MMQLVPFEKRHYHAFLAAMMPAPMGHLRTIAPQVEASTNTVTWLENGVVLAIGGVTEMWDPVGEAWVLLTPGAKARPVKLWKVADSYLRQIANEYGRIQATVASDFREGIRWALSLGFSFEDIEGRPSKQPHSKMKAYGPDGKNYYMLAYDRSPSWQQPHS